MSSKKKNNLKNKLKLEDVFCVACRCIYLRPVTMPCNHTLCLECFKNMVNITAYQCPMCRRRISNWLRKYKHDWDSLVNEKLWEEVQQQFPIEVKKRLNDEDDGLEEIIVGQGFVRVEIQEGEIKKEFDSMMMNLQQEQENIELQNLELAKKLQEEEETIRQNQNLLRAKITQEDIRLASIIQENINQELQEELLLNDSDKELARQLQEQMVPNFNQGKIAEQTNQSASKMELRKKGPLDNIFTKLNIKHKEQCNSIENDVPSCSKSSNTSSLFNSPSTSSSSFYSESSINSTTTDSCEKLQEDILDCTCGRLLDCNSNRPPCQFCIDQMTILDQLMTQHKSDYMMAKSLEDSFRKENFDDYNLRKRPNSSQSGERKKMMKLSKGQLTLKQVYKKI